MEGIENRARRDLFEGYEPLSLASCFRIVWSARWKVAAFTVVVGAVSLLVTFALPVLFRASAVIKPDVPETAKTGFAMGTLASLGIQVGGPSRVEDLEVLFKSRDLTSRVFRKHDLWPSVFPDRFDPRTGKMRGGLLDLLQGRKGPRPPGNWDAIRAARKYLAVSSDRRTGTLTISFDARTPEASAEIVRHYLEEAKSRLQEEALARANRNKKFLLEQIGKIVDPITRDRLYALYGQEVEKEMLAKNREQFGFLLIDSAEVPDRKHSPMRAVTAVLAILTAFFFACLFLLVRRQGRGPDA